MILVGVLIIVIGVITTFALCKVASESDIIIDEILMKDEKEKIK